MLRPSLPLFLILGLAVGGVACQSPAPDTTEDPFADRSAVDLTHAFNDSTVYWPTAAQEFVLEEEFVGETERGYYYAAYEFAASEHGGTHMDAPKHFAEGRRAVHQVPVEQVMGAAVVVDVSDQALDDRDYRITVDDLESWEAEHGSIPNDALLFFRTGYGQYYPDRERYMGTAERGEDALADLHFPGLHPDAAQWLVENRSIAAAGIDTPSIDYGQSKNFRAHQHLFQDDIVVLENLARLDRLPATGVHVVALPMKIRGGSGAPVRAVAFLSDDA